MPTFDLPHVGRLRLGPPGLLSPHRLLINNSKPLLGLLGLEKDRWQVTNKGNLLRTLPPRFLAWLSIMAAFRVAARAEESHQCRRRDTVGTSEQPNSEGGPIANPNITTTIR